MQPFTGEPCPTVQRRYRNRMAGITVIVVTPDNKIMDAIYRLSDLIFIKGKNSIFFETELEKFS
ncbi:MULTISPECIES: hypothetical protein [Pectobacterium]|uniref:hypothetical protein n=1 Tax=Pectobacterium TaxID=122277 RepID=UPI001CF3966F|nr:MULTISPECIES: hypothetical protein [Pectobacterium]MCA6917668.1 hypothetical protein [Pectobacterium versatile]